MKYLFSILMFILLLSPPIWGQSVKDSLDDKLIELINQSRIPGLGVSIVSDSCILYSRGFGIRDMDQNLPYDSLSIQPIASISKTIIGIALMKLAEDNKLDLNADINSILPFKVINPFFPESKITLLQLATHTSSITDTYKAESAGYYFIDKPGSISKLPKSFRKDYKRYVKSKYLEYEEYLNAYISVDGVEFEKNIFGKYKPGEEYYYSNIGGALAAYVIEVIAGQSFEDFTQENIFKPLGMENTKWEKANILSENMAQLYFQNGEEVPEYTNLFFPSSSLHTNTVDMGKYMLEIMKGYYGHGRLLDKSSYQVLLSNQIQSVDINESRGIFWQINKKGTNFGHTGSNFGVTCRLIFNPDLKKGIFLMMNIDAVEDDNLTRDQIRILQILSEYSKKLD